MTIRGVFLIAIAIGAPVRAEEPTRAEDHFNRGVAHYQVGQFVEAIGEFVLAYECSPRPNTLYNLAETHHDRALQQHRAEDAEVAVGYYRLYLRRFAEANPGQAAPRKADAEASIVELANGFPGTARRATPEGDVPTEWGQLRKQEAGAPPPDAACLPAVSPPPLRLSTRRKVGFAMAGLVVAGVAGTIVAGRQSSDAAFDWYVQCSHDVPENLRCGEIRSRFHLMEGLAIAGGVITLGAIAAAVVLFAVPEARLANAKRKMVFQLGWTAGPSAVGLTGYGSF